MKTKLLSLLTFVLLTACSETPEKVHTQKSNEETKIDVAKIVEKNTQERNTSVQKSEALAVEVSKPNGANLYAQKCASCHGKDAKKSALNASDSIAGWDSTKTQDALNGYKDGNYGKKMKNIMQGQSKPLSDNDIKLISDYISIL